jgi:prophage DNA circulation protein
MAIYTFTIGNITVTINLPVLEESILADQVVSPADWIEGFTNHISAKIERHKQIIVDNEITTARKSGRLNRLSATDDAIVQSLFNRPGYKNRNQRENG